MNEQQPNNSTNNANQNNNQNRPSRLRKALAIFGIGAAAAAGVGAAAVSHDSAPVNKNKIDAVLDQERPTITVNKPQPTPETTSAPAPETITTTTAAPQVQVPAEQVPIIDPSLDPNAPHTTAPGEMPGGGVVLENPNMGNPESAVPSGEDINRVAHQLADSFDQIYQRFTKQDPVEGRDASQTVEEGTGNTITSLKNNTVGGPEAYRAATITRTQTGDLVNVSYIEAYSVNGSSTSPNMIMTDFTVGPENKAIRSNFDQNVPFTTDIMDNVVRSAAEDLANGTPMAVR